MWLYPSHDQNDGERERPVNAPIVNGPEAIADRPPVKDRADKVHRRPAPHAVESMH